MATAINSPARSGELKFEYGQSQVVAFKFTTGKNCGEAKFPPYGPRVLFTTVDDDKLWLNADEASDIDHALLDLGVRAGEEVRITKIKHPRGGGHSYRVERIESETEALLKRSLAQARTRKSGAASETAPEPQEKTNGNPAVAHSRIEPNQLQPNGNPLTPGAAKLCASFMSAIDAVTEAQAYADRRGLKITFTSEDVRSTAISCYITACREGGR